MKIKTLGVFALLTAILPSCGGGNAGTADTTTTGDSTEITVENASEQLWLIKADSVYSSDGISLRIGTPVKEIPVSIEGLYDRVDTETGVDGIEYQFMQGDKNRFTAYDFGEAKIDLFVVYDDNIKVTTPLEGIISIGSPFGDVLSLPGVKAEWSELDGEGQWNWVWEGLWFAPDNRSLPEATAKKLYNSSAKFTQDDFKGVNIGYLATGLPY